MNDFLILARPLIDVVLDVLQQKRYLHEWKDASVINAGAMPRQQQRKTAIRNVDETDSTSTRQHEGAIFTVVETRQTISTDKSLP